MTYVMPNYGSATALKQAIRNGDSVDVFEPGIGTVPGNGTVHLEGPHSPQSHTWYAKGTMENGVLVKVSTS